jgi:serine protease Do
MRTFKNQAHWIVALMGGMCLVAAAATVADRPSIEPPISVASTQELSSAFRRVSKDALPCVVTIATKGPARELKEADLEQIPEQFREFFKGPQRLPQAGMGSGFIIDKSGIIVTNNHVIAGAEEIVVRLLDGREFRGLDAKTDPRTDIAIIRIEAGEPLPEIRFGDSDQSQIGDWVLAIGNPFNQEMSVTSGIISAKGRGPRITEREDFIQTDAAINPGNSGGPLLNLNGDVIGVNTAISSRTGGYDGIGFAVPSNMAYWVVKQLVETGEVRRAYLGVSIVEVTNRKAQELGLKVHEGVIVDKVIANSPAYEAGIASGDVILKLNGTAVSSPRELQGVVEQLNVDEKYPVDILRDGSRLALSIPMKAMPNDYSLTLRPPMIGRNDRSQPPQKPDEKLSKNVNRFGFAVESITPSVAKAVGVQDGVVVSEVDPNRSAAGGLGLGDVIQQVGSTNIKTLSDFNAAMEKASDKTLAVRVYDQGKSRLLILNIDR